MKLYYAYPYSSWERGTNENSNKLVRRFIPKGIDMNTISEAAIKRIEYWMTNYPRRIFNYKSANDMVALVAYRKPWGLCPQTPALTGGRRSVGTDLKNRIFN
ncbi:MAG: hypothetical protein APF76_04580 [Desulfitibacter sp. BRH_c19]|nr:MAG: hypothetical protein APF76_04580 [Desulfitibacter sp. BRH_c19]